LAIPVPDADLLLHHAIVVTMDAQRRVFGDGAIAIRDERIVEIGCSASLTPGWPADRMLDLDGMVAMPGLVNAHVHMTGGDLLPGLEPSSTPLADHLPRWTLPAYEHSTPDDDRAASRFVALQMLRHGTTAFIEAGTCRFPEAVLDGLAGVPIRGAIGAWAWDRASYPPAFATTTAEALARIEAAMALPPKARIQVWPNVLGFAHSSDELLLAAAGLARSHDRHMTFHLSPRPGVVTWRGAGVEPLTYLERLGVLDYRCVLGHAIHISDSDLAALERTGASVAFCPTSALHLPSGLTRRGGRHPEMPHVALGTDAQNAANHLDLLRSGGLACDLYADLRDDRATLPAERALEWLTLGGAHALGMQDEIGSLEVGKRADIAVFEVTKPVYNVANALVHGSARAVHVFVDGAHVLRDGRVRDDERIIADVTRAGRQVAQRAGLPTWSGWPVL
jgi:5-methylthioadenosine/S-adenosylhomocysteine deaminase